MNSSPFFDGFEARKEMYENSEEQTMAIDAPLFAEGVQAGRIQIGPGNKFSGTITDENTLNQIREILTRGMAEGVSFSPEPIIYLKGENDEGSMT